MFGGKGEGGVLSSRLGFFSLGPGSLARPLNRLGAYWSKPIHMLRAGSYPDDLPDLLSYEV